MEIKSCGVNYIIYNEDNNYFYGVSPSDKNCKDKEGHFGCDCKAYYERFNKIKK